MIETVERLVEDTLDEEQSFAAGSLYDRAKTIDAELTRLRGLTEWRPMGSAPRDGTSIAVSSERGQFIVQWLGPKDNERAYSEGWYVDDGKRNVYGLRGPTPTHWKPLGNPPIGDE